MKKDKKKRAAAIKHNGKDEKDLKVVASGRWHLAEEIIRLAKENDIPIEEDPDLVEVLMKLDINECLPDDLYPVIAEILTYLYQINKKE